MDFPKAQGSSGSPTTTSGSRRKSRVGRQRCESTVSMRIPIIAADALLLDQIEPPEEVDLFGQFEELCKAYAIEPPYAARSQVELMFDVYDGRKLQQTSLEEDAYSDEPTGQSGRSAGEEALEARSRGHSSGGLVGWGSRRIKEAGRRGGANFSWCRLVSLVRSRKRSMRCCLAASDTQAELCALSLTSAASLGNGLLGRTSVDNSNEFISAAFSPELDDDQEDADLKVEALRLMGPLANQLRRSSTLSEAAYCARLEQTSVGQASCLGEPAQQHLILDGAEFNQRHISVCLFDKRSRSIQLKHEAENGRHWNRLFSRVEELRHKLTGAAYIQGSGERATLNRLAERLNRIQRQAGRRKPPSAISERIVNREHMEQLVSLTKNSLNHLIDAQLLLRNKLSSEQQQQYQTNAGVTQNKTSYVDYETLLKNNFNLLKIWQNLDETKRLACFVCEPIKANLGDLFWFNRQRAEVRGTFCGGTKSCLLSSPLVCLDALEVKRGLIQVSKVSIRRWLGWLVAFRLRSGGSI